MIPSQVTQETQDLPRPPRQVRMVRMNSKRGYQRLRIRPRQGRHRCPLSLTSGIDHTALDPGAVHRRKQRGGVAQAGKLQVIVTIEPDH